ncbi:MAG TPA: hypothetical protein VGI71_17870 [Scandinavium sp.]|jgi:hypothetical protein
MDELAIIPWLARELENAASGKEWPKLQQVDKQIALLLSDLKGRQLSPSMTGQLAELRTLHRKVYQYCQQESDLLEEKMVLARKNKEGASAYAAFIPTEDNR